MRRKVGIIKRVTCLGLIFLLSINSFAAIVSDNDGSAFITKAEFDALKSGFQAQIDSYNQSIDSKIDGAIASYLAGIMLATSQIMEYASPQKIYKTLDTTNFPSTKDGFKMNIQRVGLYKPTMTNNCSGYFYMLKYEQLPPENIHGGFIEPMNGGWKLWRGFCQSGQVCAQFQGTYEDGSNRFESFYMRFKAQIVESNHDHNTINKQPDGTTAWNLTPAANYLNVRFFSVDPTNAGNVFTSDASYNDTNVTSKWTTSLEFQDGYTDFSDKLALLTTTDSSNAGYIIYPKTIKDFKLNNRYYKWDELPSTSSFSGYQSNYPSVTRMASTSTAAPNTWPVQYTWPKKDGITWAEQFDYLDEYAPMYFCYAGPNTGDVGNTSKNAIHDTHSYWYLDNTVGLDANLYTDQYNSNVLRNVPSSYKKVDGATTYYKLRGGLILTTGTQMNGVVEFEVKNNKAQDTLFWLNDAPFEFKTQGMQCVESTASLGNAVVIPANSTKTIHCNVTKNKDLYFRFGIKPGSGWQNVLPGAEIEFIGDIELTSTD